MKIKLINKHNKQTNITRFFIQNLYMKTVIYGNEQKHFWAYLRKVFSSGTSRGANVQNN